jgi:hypothetical protein
MKKLTILLTLLILLLTACGASDSAAPAPVTQTDPAAAALSTDMKLLVGILKLEGTDQAVTAAQAAELLPLWQVYSELLTSNTSAQAETDALLAQIEDTMTNEQMQAIEAMHLTQQEFLALMQEQGVGMSLSSASNNNSTTSSQSGGGMAPPDGGMLMGDPPADGGGGMPMGSAGGSSSTGSATNTTAMNPASLMINSLIELLEGKSAS